MRLLAAVLALTVLGLPEQHQDSPMTKAAKVFVASLSEDQMHVAVMAAESPDRTAWGYVPGPRKGVAWSDLTEPQQALGRELLKVSLSENGYHAIESIRSFEDVLKAMENNPGRDHE